ncbi:Diphthamide biosynthesis protein 2 [Aphelenchoides besseyi]|nr:Diphthamide biosynthesis protein 2 [Aphelenchoides besseyi]KAI6228278.1 Diphthamide biosynthesis protein 2 [Aphelenchoides besseyi]
MSVDGVKLWSDDQVAVTDTQLDTSRLYQLNLESEKVLCDFFEVDRIVQWIREGAYKRTALQLPDGLLKYAYRLTSTLETKLTETKFYILADTSYRSCCVDDVAAQHSNCDSLVHFGETCLSSTSRRVPVLYVFGRFPIQLDEFQTEVKSFVESKDLTSSRIFLLYDAVFSHCIDDLRSLLTSELPSGCQLISCDVIQPSDDLNDANIQLGRNVPVNLRNASDKPQHLFFVGTENSPLLSIWCMTFTCFVDFAHYSPENHKMTIDNTSTHRQLRKRLFLVEKLRDANVVGLVVGTLDLKGYREAIQRIRELCKAANKKLYVFSIGKLNEAKLSNFASDIDVFILLSCPFGIVLDSTDFYKPILSMFEAEIALNSAKEWFASDGWTAEFGNFLSDTISPIDQEKADVSLITGRVRGVQIVENESNNTNNQNRQVVEYSAGDYFVNRSWKGLDNDYHEDDDTTMKEGLKGLARDYAEQSRN